MMDVWKDDNALFFKLFHIEDRAGYFGYGLIGTGLYRFLVLPHYIVFNLFGVSHIWLFYLQAFAYYFLATILVYQLFRRIFSEKVGKISSFLFGCGFIASEGFLWLNESIVHSLSIVLVCTTLICYYNFSKSRKPITFLLTLALYALTGFITPVRTQYFIALLILFDLFWVVKKKNLRGLFSWILRSIPFMAIFYWLYIGLADERTQALPDYVKLILSGQFYNLYSFFGTVGNIFAPDVIQNFFLSNFDSLLLKPRVFLSSKILIVIIIGLLINWLFSKKKYGFLFIAAGLIWIYLSKIVLASPQLSTTLQGKLAVFLGGLVFITIFFSWIKSDQKVKLGIFFLTAWLVGNLFGYVSYLPLSIYATTDRYLAHSFVPAVALLALLVSNQKKKIILILVILWGLLNIVNSVIYQYDIVQNRSRVVRDFYQQLKTELPVLHKEDVVYFDIADNSIGNFSSAFSVGSMPETTALAWRYGLDRYDFQMFSSFADFKKVAYVTPPDKIYSFWYSDKGLTDTTQELRKLLSDSSTNNLEAKLPLTQKTTIKRQQDVNYLSQSDLEINFDKPIRSILPIELTFDINATPLLFENSDFPTLGLKEEDISDIAKDPNLAELAFKYGNFKQTVLAAKYSSSSDWQDRVLDNIHDQDLSTVWEADRILWSKQNEYITIELESAQEIDKFIWINGFSSNTPTKYVIETSVDGKDFKQVQSIDNPTRLDTITPQVISFDPVVTKFIRMRISETLNTDAPALSEAWVSSPDFAPLDIISAENYLKQPFQYIRDMQTFNNLLIMSNKKAPAKIFWKGDKSITWTSTDLSKIDLVYDGQDHIYKVTIYAGGSQIDSLKIADLGIPGTIHLNNISYRYVKLD